MWSHTQRIVDLATRRRLPALYPYKDPVKTAEGLLAYGVDEPACWRRIAYYVDKIFEGAEPADLPVKQPAAFYLIINLKTAKALGVTIPQSLLLRADEVIQ